MSYDGLSDRNEYLKREGINSWDLTNAGVSDYESAETARSKVAQYQGQYQTPYPSNNSYDDFPSLGGGSGGGYSDGPAVSISGKTLLKIILCLFLVPVAIALWSAKDELIEHIRESQRNEAAAKRMEQFSDFSKLSDWPEWAQKAYEKQKNKPLVKLLDEIPQNHSKLSPERRRMLGAQVWFKISSKGVGAHDYLVDVQNTPHRVPNPILRAAGLSLNFLKRECDRGVEMACTDAAKSFAGLVWHGKGSSEEYWVIESALKQLPTTGSLAKSPAITSLRERITYIGAPLAR